MLRIFIGLTLFCILLALDWRLGLLCLALYGAYIVITMPFRLLGLIYYCFLWVLAQIYFLPARLFRRRKDAY